MTFAHRQATLFAVLGTLSVSGASSAQHFAMPDDPDPSNGLLMGEPCSSIGRPTTSFGSAVDDGWLYVLGGYSGRPHDYNRDGQSREFYRINLFDPGHQEQLPNNQQAMRRRTAGAPKWTAKRRQAAVEAIDNGREPAALVPDPKYQKRTEPEVPRVPPEVEMETAMDTS